MSNSNILQKEHNQNYKTISLDPIQSYPNLSWKAKGLWTYLISRPEGWEFRLTDIIKRANDGRTAVKSAMQELKDIGLLKITQDKDKEGKFYSLWTVTEDPVKVSNPPPENPTPDNPTSDNPTSDNQQGSNVVNSNVVDSNKDQVYTLFNYWKEKSETLNHRKLTEPMEKGINARLKDYTVDELKEAIDNYNEVVASDKYWFDYNNWSLNEFLSRGEGEQVEKFLTNQNAYLKDDEGTSKPKTRRPQTNMTEEEREMLGL